MIKVLELFAGIGACSKALERLGIEHEIVDAVEIDKFAIASFNAIHGTNFEPQDITKWDKDLEVDLIMHGSPCQDFSVAGKQAGGDIDSGTRSSLMYETIRIVGKLRPKYIVWENVKNLLSKKHKHNFDAYIETINILGYNSYYQVLNAKDYGIPQNRERVFTISIRKDIDKGFEFPQKEELKLRLKDMLEDEVDDKYYLSDTGVIYFEKQAEKRGENLNLYTEKRVLTVAHGVCKGSNKPAIINPTLDTQYSNNWRGVILEPKIKDKCNDKRLKKLAEKTEFVKGEVLNLDTYNQTTNKDISQCLTEPHHNSQRLFDGLRIRKLTPKECWRLMGFDDEDFEKAEKVNSNTQLYKQARKLNLCTSVRKNIRKLIKYGGVI